jgi:hypothetical protein
VRFAPGGSVTILQPGRNQSALIPSDEFRKLKESLIHELKPAVSVIRAISHGASGLDNRERERVVRALEKVERILFDLENDF